MDRAYARASQHGKRSLCHHGHINQHPIALTHTQRLQGSRHALHFGMQLPKAVDLLGVGFGRDGNQRRLVGSGGQVAIDRVVAQVGGAAHKPAGKWRIAVVADLLGWCVPVNQGRLFSPKAITVFDGTAVKVGVACHCVSPVGPIKLNS